MKIQSLAPELKAVNLSLRSSIFWKMRFNTLSFPVFVLGNLCSSFLGLSILVGELGRKNADFLAC